MVKRDMGMYIPNNTKNKISDILSDKGNEAKTENVYQKDQSSIKDN